MEKEPILSNRENGFCASKRHTQDTQDKMRKEIFFAFFTESALFSCKGVYKKPEKQEKFLEWTR